MGQKLSPETSPETKADVPILCDVFSQGIVFASQKLKEYLGFEDPQSKFHLATETLNEIFLVNFIRFCVEKGMEERITTSKMTSQQASLFGTDWVWTLSGADKQIKLQIAVQSSQWADLLGGGTQPPETNGSSREANEILKNKSRFEKLEEFCSLVGKDCLGLFILCGVPGKPKDIRGVILESLKKEKGGRLLSGEDALREFVLNTDDFLPVREMLEYCLSKKNGLRGIVTKHSRIAEFLSRLSDIEAPSWIFLKDNIWIWKGNIWMNKGMQSERSGLTHK